MGFDSQFHNFSPINGRVPKHPFPSLPDIASRSRRILHGRTDEQVLAAAKIIYLIIEQERESQSDAERAFEQETHLKLGLAYNEYDDHELRNYIAYIENLSDLSILKNCDNPCLEFKYAGIFPNPKIEELFAVLALWLVGDVLELLELEQDYDVNNSAAEYAIEAMDALCYAERIGNVEFLKEDYLRAKEQFINQVAGERTEKHKKLNKIRHANNAAAKNLALTEWERDKSKYLSAAQAGKNIAEWLENQNSKYKYEARTVTEWIRARARETGVRFR